MRILLVGAGGVGDAIAKIAARRSFFDAIIVSDYDLSRAERTIAWIAAKHPEQAAKYIAAKIDASDPESVAAVAREHQATHVMNAVEPKFVPTIFAGAIAAGADYLDMAMSLSEPHPENPYSETGVKLGDDQFAQADDWEKAGRLALVGMGVEPGLSDVFARYAADELFGEIDELGTRDGANLVVRDEAGEEIFAPSFSIWTTIEECLNPPVIWEKDKGWFTTPPFSEPETFVFPDGIGPVECVNVEHEEVLLMPRWVDAKRVTFKYGLGDEFIGILKTLHQLGLDKTEPLRVRSADGPGDGGASGCGRRRSPRPRDPGPAHDRQDLRRALGHRHRQGRQDARGVPVPRERQRVDDGRVREPVRRVADGAEPVIALELLATGTWSGTGVLGPEAFDARPFLELMAKPEKDGGYGQAWGMEDVRRRRDPPVRVRPISRGCGRSACSPAPRAATRPGCTRATTCCPTCSSSRM